MPFGKWWYDWAFKCDGIPLYLCVCPNMDMGVFYLLCVLVTSLCKFGISSGPTTILNFPQNQIWSRFLVRNLRRLSSILRTYYILCQGIFKICFHSCQGLGRNALWRMLLCILTQSSSKITCISPTWHNSQVEEFLPVLLTKGWCFPHP